MAITALTTTFTSGCKAAGTLISSPPTTAATAFDYWGATSTPFATSLATLSGTTVPVLTNKGFAQMISQIARANLVTLVKAEKVAAMHTEFKDIIKNSALDCYNNANKMNDADVDAGVKATMITSFTAAQGVITAALNRAKAIETTIYSTGTSIDVASGTGTGNVISTVTGVVTPATFVGAKVYLAALLDPSVLGNAGVAIPAITATTASGTVTTTATAYNNAQLALTASTLVAQEQALVSLASKNVFDLYCMCAQGYLTAAGTTGTYATGTTATVGIVPGIDYLLQVDGSYQTGTAAAGTAGAPSDIAGYW